MFIEIIFEAILTKAICIVFQNPISRREPALYLHEMRARYDDEITIEVQSEEFLPKVRWQIYYIGRRPAARPSAWQW
jgi:hypothetical protein